MGNQDNDRPKLRTPHLPSMVPTKVWSVSELLGDDPEQAKVLEAALETEAEPRTPPRPNRHRLIDAESGPTRLYPMLLKGESGPIDKPAPFEATRPIPTEESTPPPVTPLLYPQQLAPPQPPPLTVPALPPSPVETPRGPHPQLAPPPAPRPAQLPPKPSPPFETVPVAASGSIPESNPPESNRLARRHSTPARLREGTEPRWVDGYEVLARLRRLPDGTEYLCRPAEDATARLTMKVLRAQLPNEKRDAEAFLRRANRVAKVVHPRIVPLLDAGVYQRQPYFVRPHIEGTTLASLLSNRCASDRPCAFVLRLFEDVLEGMAAAHDLKPRRGSTANYVHGALSAESIHVTPLGRCLVSGIGEVEARKAIASERTDDYLALGGLLYESLTGVRPDLTRGAAAVPPTRLNTTVPESVDSLCLRMLTPTESNLGSAASMLREVRRVVATERLRAPTDELIEWMGSPRESQLPPERQSFPSLAVLEPEEPTVVTRLSFALRRWLGLG